MARHPLHARLRGRAGVLASPAARVHDPGPRPPEAQPKGGLMFRPSSCPENRVRYMLGSGIPDPDAWNR